MFLLHHFPLHDYVKCSYATHNLQIQVQKLKKIIIFFLLIFKVQDIACPQSTISPLVFPLPYKLKADVFINEKEGI